MWRFKVRKNHRGLKAEAKLKKEQKENKAKEPYIKLNS